VKRSSTTAAKLDLDGHFYLGVCYYELFEYKQAIISFNKVLSIRNNYYEALIMRGKCFFIEKSYQNAINDFIESLDIKPENEIYFLVGVCYDELKQPQSAIEIYTYLEERELKNKDRLFNNIANILIQRKAYSEAIEYMNSAINLNRNIGLYYYNRGRAYLKNEEKNKAKLDFETAQKLGFEKFEADVIKHMK